MPGYKDWVPGPLLEMDLDDYVGKQVVLKYASAAARDADATLTAARREGMVCYLDDTDVLSYYNGSAWVDFHRGLTAQPTYDPILNQSATVTYTKTRATHRKVGRDVVFDFDLSVTGAGTAGTDISVELPFATAANQVGGVIGQGFVFDTSVPEARAGLLIATSTTYAKFQSLAVGPISYIGSAVVTLAVNDVVRGSGSYEAAA